MAEPQGPTLDNAQTIDAIRHVCADKVFCRVSPPDSESRASMAKFLYTERHDDGSRELQISVPAGVEGDPEKGTPLRVAFDHDDRGMNFLTEFRQRVIHREKGRKEQEAWRIAFPQTINIMQRREFYRVKTDLVNPVRISIEIPGHEEEENISIIGEMDSFEEIAGTLWDVSGGGLSFRLALAPAFPLTRGMMLKMSMELPGTEGVTSLSGRLVYIKERADADKLYCVQFTDAGADVDAKHALNNVLHYVAERERATLASKSRLEDED
ncbi:MAG: PilZ domain-containing protein [Planctomycetes bacterium]|nr:PilZ domain-containing protein [Planctomycetota bacterium]NUQ33578.1 PilZ domain-containing protein [Planctomycetaceae bacterium]